MPSALEYLHSAAELAGRYEQRTTTAAGSQSTFVCSAFVNSVLSSSDFANWGVLIESGCCLGEVGMLSNAPLATASGTFTTATTFTQAIASGVAFSLYSRDRLPPLRIDGKPGWFDMLNRALQRTFFEDTLNLTGVTGQIHYTIDLSAYPWWSDDVRIVDVQLPVTNTDYVPVILPREWWDWVADGETLKLRFPSAPFNTGETATLKINRPGNTRLKLSATARATIAAGAVTALTVIAGGYYQFTPNVQITGGGGSGATATANVVGNTVVGFSITAGGSGYTTTPTVTIDAGVWHDQTTQTAGLVTINDEAIPDVRLLRPMMLALGYYALAEQGQPGQTQEEWRAKGQRWEQIAVGIKRARTPRDRDNGVLRLRSATVCPWPQTRTGWW